MRVYTVQPGDSPASIAAQDNMAGCPKCSRDLVDANPQKARRTFPNGFTTFETLVPGERLALPEKWFDGSLDSRPQAYFNSLPYSDGVTPSTLGAAAAGILGDFATLDAASAAVAALPQMDTPTFSTSVGNAASLIDRSVVEVSGNPTAAGHVQDEQASTAWARQRNVQLAASLQSGDEDGATAARAGIQDVLSTALDSARMALQAFYTPAVPTGGAFPAAVTAAAQAAAAAINADANYCASVAKSGTAINSAVHAFKTAWNASQPAKIPIGTSNYEEETAEAIADVLGGAPLPCNPHAAPTSAPPIPTLPIVVTPPQKTDLSTASVVSIGLLGASAVGGAVYFSTRKPKRRRRR